MAKGCPHKNIQFCPLYVASHGLQAPSGEWLGCDDGKLGDGHCAVDRGMKYAREVAKLQAAHPGLVEQLAFKEEAAEEWNAAKAARDRRLGRLH